LPFVFTNTGISGVMRSGWITRSTSTVASKRSTVRRALAVLGSP
jgi:hypothetical protein